MVMASTLYHAHAFVDGGYLRELARGSDQPLVNPRMLANNIVFDNQVQTWGSVEAAGRSTALARVIYYDARPDVDEEVPAHLLAYWDAIELLNDTELGFGSLRGGTKRRPPRQKAVDTLLAVDMLVGAFSRLFQVAILVAGDADFVPVVNEVRRRGVMVTVAASERSMSLDLRRSADRFIAVGPELEARWFPPLQVNGKTWR